MTAPPKEVNSNKRRNAIIILTIVLIAIAIVWLLLWLFHFRFYESTDDAYANGSMVNINSAVPGSVIAFYADDTALVKEGQLLVSLDPTSYEIAYENELSALASTVLKVKQLYENVKAETANRNSKKILLEKARYDYTNRSKLVDFLAVSQEEYTHSKDELSTAEFALEQAEANLKAAQDAAGPTSWENHPILEEQKSKVRKAYYNLHHCSIYAPVTGYVAQRRVNVGEWAKVDSPLMAIIPIDYVWVDANFKETQLTNMRVGQPATVTLDIYGSDVVYEGKVLGIASGTGSVFSLIPPQNATGNWIKIVQRLPVRISLNPDKVKEFPIRLGLSADARVDISNTELPKLVQEVSEKPVTATEIFDIDFKKVNETINSIIGSS